MAVTVASTSASGTWNKLFPTETQTEVYSLVFIKKLFAVAVSYALFMRRIFPDSAFFDKQLDGINLKILREDNKYPGSSKVVYWLRGCFDAIDRQYLKAASLTLFSKGESTVGDPTQPYTSCKVIESYHFKMIYSNSSLQFEVCTLADKNNSKHGILSMSDDGVKAATLNLLKSIRTAGENLRALPSNMYMTMRLQYHENTPEDYEPLGFRDAGNISFDFEGSPVNIRIGSVQTTHHNLKMHMQVNKFFLNALKRPYGDFTGPADTSQHSVDMSMQGLTISSEKQNEGEELACTQKQTLQSDDTEDEIYDVRCPCGVHKDDGVMIVCDGCGMWQHAVCFRILEEADVPTSHICEHCSESRPDLLEKGGVTDLSLQNKPEDTRRSMCLLRRAVLLCTNLDSLSPAVLAKSLDVEYTVARGLFNRLIKEGVLKETGNRRGEKLVERELLESVILAKIFFNSLDQPRKKPLLDAMDEFVSQKSAVNSQTSTVRRTPRRSFAIHDPSKTNLDNLELSLEASQESSNSPIPTKRRKRTGIANTPVSVGRK